MVTSELGACEWFVWDLRRSNLIDRGQLDQVVGEFLSKNPRAEPQALAEFLIGQGILSQFQAERLLQGKTQGFVMGPFTLADALGAGSMGTVYKAQSKNDQQWYAVKVLPRRSMWNVRIARRKVRAFEQCRHPSVVPFVDVGTSGGMHYLVWPFVEGETLDKIVAQQGRLSPSLAAGYAIQIVEGLEVCHEQGLFHGLLKPSNIAIGADHQVYILDLGIGCLLAETEGESLVDTMSTANAVTSGLDCASPESIMDPTNLTPAGDQYSLGCTLYFALTGQYPFPEGSAAEKMMAHQLKEPMPIDEIDSDIPAAFVQIVTKLMSKKPENRYGSVRELKEALRPLAGAAPSAGVRPPRVTPNPITPPPSRLVPPTPAPSRQAPLPAARLVPPTPAPLPTPVPASSAGNFTPRSLAGPSQPTPRPPQMGELPNRSAVRGKSNPGLSPAPTAVPLPVAEPIDRVVPGAVPDVPEFQTMEDRLGPVGITLGAIAACALVWVLAIVLRLF